MISIECTVYSIRIKSHLSTSNVGHNMDGLLHDVDNATAIEVFKLAEGTRAQPIQ
jgi:hypothetical protein